MPPRQLAVCDVPPIDEHDLVMLDLDGVVYVGPEAVPGAAEALMSVTERGVALAYLTNNASRPATTVAEHLRELGMPLASDADVVTSAQAISRVIAEEHAADSPVLLIGGEGLRVALEAAGLRPVDSLDDSPVAVVQGYHPDLGWRDLAEAAYAVQSGLPWFVSNTDLTIPTDRGIAPGNGSLVQAVRNATKVDPVVAGKPFRPLFDETLERTGAARPLMVGDRLDTDIEGAVNAGIRSMMVMTGVDDLAAVWACPAKHRPDLVAPDLAGLLHPHPVVRVSDDQATCGAARATLDDGVVSGEGDGIELLRAATALAWATVDTSGRAPAPSDRLQT